MARQDLGKLTRRAVPTPAPAEPVAPPAPTDVVPMEVAPIEVTLLEPPTSTGVRPAANSASITARHSAW